MTAPSAPTPEPPRPQITINALARIWATMAIFGIVNLFVSPFGLQAKVGVIVGLLYLVIIIMLAALAYFKLHWHYVALGLLAGYIFLTICSAGACTLLNTVSNGEFGSGGAIYGAILYPLALAIFFVALLIATFIANRSK